MRPVRCDAREWTVFATPNEGFGATHPILRSCGARFASSLQSVGSRYVAELVVGKFETSITDDPAFRIKLDPQGEQLRMQLICPRRDRWRTSKTLLSIVLFAVGCGSNSPYPQAPISSPLGTQGVCAVCKKAIPVVAASNLTTDSGIEFIICSDQCAEKVASIGEEE